MGALSQLYVELTLAADNFNNGLRDAQREAKAFEQNIRPSINAAKELGEALSAVGDVVAIGMAEATLKTAEYGAELEHLHVRSGVAVEDAARLGYAATQNGSSFEGLGNSLKFLLKNMELAETGSKKQELAFASLGISQKDLIATGGNTAAAFALLADHVKGLGDPTSHAADLAAILGKNWTELLPTLMLGSEGLKAAGDAAERAGIVMSGEAAEQSKQFEQGLKDLKASAEGLGIAIGAALMPTLKALVDAASSGTKDIKDFVTAHQDLTIAIGAAAAAIGGAGGLLLVTAAVLKVLPELRDAFVLLTSATGIMTAGILVAVGALAAIAVAAKQAHDAWKDTATAETDAAAATQKLHDQIMAAGGPDIKMVNGNFAEWNQQVIQAARGIKDLDPALTAQIKAQHDAADAAKKHADELKAEIAAQEAAKKAAEELQKSIEHLVDSVTEETKKGPALVGALEQMMLAHTNDYLIVDKLGKQILAYRDALVLEGKEVDAVTQYYADFTIKLNTANATLQAQIDFWNLWDKEVAKNAANLLKYTTDYVNGRSMSAAADTQYAKNLQSVSDLQTQFLKDASRDELKEKIDAINEQLKADTDYYQFRKDAAQALLDTQKQMDDAYANYHQAILDIQSAMDAQYDQDTINQLIDFARQQETVWRTYAREHETINRDIANRTDQNLKQLQQLYVSADQAAQNMTLEMAKAMSSITTGIANGLADSIVHWKNFGDTLISLAQNVAGSMLSAFLKGLLNPLTNALTSLGTSLAGSLVGLITGAGGGGGGIGLGSSLLSGGGGGLGLLAGGGGLLAGITGASGLQGLGALLGVQSFSGTGLGLTGGGLIGLASNPITIAAAAAVGVGLLINHFIGQGRKTADQFVQNVQNPFGAQLGQLVDAFDQANANGTLTLDQANQAKQSLDLLIQQFTNAATKFGSQGSTQQTVVNQAWNTMNTDFGVNFQKIYDDFNAAISKLTASAAAATNASNTNTSTSSNITTSVVNLTNDVVKALGQNLSDLNDSIKILVSKISPTGNVPQTGLVTSASQQLSDAVNALVPVLKAMTPSVVAGAPGASTPAPMNVTVNYNLQPGAIAIDGVDLDTISIRNIIEAQFLSDTVSDARGFGTQLKAALGLA